MTTKTINIAKEFSDTTGPRYRSQGDFSGQKFRETILEPAFLEALKAGERLTIELDGARYSYGPSFLEESFGGLARNHGIEPVLRTLHFVSREEPLLPEEIVEHIKRCNSKGAIKRQA